MKLSVPDVISNSYFPAVAAIDLGFFANEGLDVELELIVPVTMSLDSLREGAVDFVGGSAHSVAYSFPGWQGASLLCGLSQHMYWFLVLRSDLNAARGEIEKIKGLRIGAAPLVELGLKAVLADVGIDEQRDGVSIGPVPGAFLDSGSMNFGVAAAKALEAGLIDGFWANGMGAAVAVRDGAGTIVLDSRRGDGPPGSIRYTMPALVATDTLIEREPGVAEAAVRAIVATQRALIEDVTLAEKVGRKRFPSAEADLITELIRRDLPYYTAEVSPEFVSGMIAFQQRVGLLSAPVSYDQVVAPGMSQYWEPSTSDSSA